MQKPCNNNPFTRIVHFRLSRKQDYFCIVTFQVLFSGLGYAALRGMENGREKRAEEECEKGWTKEEREGKKGDGKDRYSFFRSIYQNVGYIIIDNLPIYRFFVYIYPLSICRLSPYGLCIYPLPPKLNSLRIIMA